MGAIVVGAAVLGIVLAAGCGGGDDSDDASAPTTAPEPVTFELLEENESGQTGTATLTDKDLSGTGVTLKVSPPDRYPGDVQIPALADATCAEMRELTTIPARERKVVKVLTEVRDGASETTSARPLAELTSGGYAIIVFQQNPPYAPVLCGEIPKR